uniref:Uncharacterized protein n=1 Tax=Salix viminalis TaxID=40686 RepID=A0A6N2MWZ1_SALVM
MSWKQRASDGIPLFIFGSNQGLKIGFISLNPSWSTRKIRTLAGEKRIVSPSLSFPLLEFGRRGRGEVSAKQLMMR